MEAARVSAVAVEFLRAWHPGGPWSVGAIDPDDSSGHAWLTTRDEGELAAFLDAQAALRRNLYYQVNLARPDLGTMRAYRHSMVVAVAAQAEVDPPESVRSAPTPEARLAALEAWQLEYLQRVTTDEHWTRVGVPRPALILFSGTGVQFAWRLAEPVVLWAGDPPEQDPAAIELVESRNRKFVETLGADPASTDVSRLLRLPGTLNWPGESKRSKYGRAEPTLAEVVELDLSRACPIGLLPAAPPVAAEPGESRAIPDFAGLPPDDKLLAAVQALAAAWPASGRHLASLALCGALARQGWPAEHVAEFVYAVCETAQPGNGDYAKRLSQAERSVEMARAGEATQGWPSLEQHVGRVAIDAACAALGVQTAPQPDEQFVARLEQAIPAAAAIPTPSQGSREDAYKSVAKKLSTRKDTDAIRDARLLRKVVSGEFLSEATEPDDVRRRELALAAVAAARAAPPGTTAEQLVADLTPCAGSLAPELRDHVVPGAMAAAAQMPPILAKAPRAPTSATPSTAYEPSGSDPASDFVLRKSGDDAGLPVSTSAHNMRLALSRLGVELRYNSFANHELIVRDGVEVIAEDAHYDGLAFEIEQTFGFYPPVDKFYRFCGTLARERSFHPVLEYLDSLPVHDGVPRVDTWLIDCAGAPDTPYVRAISRMFLVAAVRRVRRPGAKFDEMLILETPEQGKQKSSALRVLAVRDEWFLDDFSLDDKRADRMQSTMGKWIVEAGELKGMSQADHNELKSYLSRQVDEARLAYGRKLTRVPRQFIVFGTTNEERYLGDATGLRRYMPIRVREFDVEKLREMREQLWAEASALEAANPEDSYIRLDPALYGAARAEQEKRRVLDSIHLELADALTDVTGTILVKDVSKLLGYTGDKRPSKRDEMSIAAAMRVLGWENIGQATMRGVRGTYYARGTREEREVVLGVTGNSAQGFRVAPVVSPAGDGVAAGQQPAPN